MSAENADRPAAGGAPVGVPAGLPPLTGSKLAIGTIALSLATFMNVLDTSIANVSIPGHRPGDFRCLGRPGHLGDRHRLAWPTRYQLPLTGWLTTLLRAG